MKRVQRQGQRMHGEENRTIKRQRDLDTDLMRIAAAFAVVTLHISPFSSPWGIICSAAARFSVPVFVLISGYYLLPKEAAIKDAVRRTGHTLAMALLWSAAYFAVDLLRGARHYEGLSGLLRYLVTEPVHLWYLWAAAGLYMLTPILSVFCRNADQKTYQYGLAVTFLMGTVITIMLRAGAWPLLEEAVLQTKLPYQTGFVFLYLAGGYFSKYPVKRPWILCALGLLGACATILWTFWMPDRAAELALSFFAPNTALAGLGFFVLIKEAAARLPEMKGRLRRAVSALAECTGGIYLIHIGVIHLVGFAMPWLNGFYPLLMIICKALAVYVLSFVMVKILRMVPLFRYWM